MTEFRSGFCVLAGRPNVGKSTLMNALIGTKVAIISPRPQTTRNRIVGVYHGDGYQIVFLDTPGIHKPRTKLGQHMMKTAVSTLRESDVVVLVVDVSVLPGPGDDEVARLCQSSGARVIVACNKVDLVTGNKRELHVTRYGELGYPVMECSALTGYGIDVLRDALAATMEPGPEYYPQDMVTAEPERQLVAEFVREQALNLTRDEVPHAVGVRIEEFSERENGMIYVSAVILVERESQKGIVVGSGGSMLKEIGQKARAEIEALLGTRVYLDLWVKVAPKWRNRERVLRELGYYRS